MKNYLALLITSVVILFSSCCSAQIQLGPKAGLTGYQLISGGNNGVKLGLYAGGFLDYELNNKLNLQADVAYVEKGSKDEQRKTLLNYLEFSPKAKFFTNINKGNRGFYIATGFGFNFLIDDKIKINDEVAVEELGLNSFDLSLQFGIGYKFKNNLSLDFKIIDGSLTTASSENSNLRNIGANITVAYGFDL